MNLFFRDLYYNWSPSDSFQDVFGADLFQINNGGEITTKTNTLDREYAALHVLLVEARDDVDHVATGRLIKE